MLKIGEDATYDVATVTAWLVIELHGFRADAQYTSMEITRAQSTIRSCRNIPDDVCAMITGKFGHVHAIRPVRTPRRFRPAAVTYNVLRVS